MSMDGGIAREHLLWLEIFRTRHGRPLRVLHVGNIANNAYLNAKFLRSVGVDAQVLSHDYYHVMACPEWEEVEITHAYGGDNSPTFSKRDLKSYRRPRWFIQAPLAKSATMIGDNFGGQGVPGYDERASEQAEPATLDDLMTYLTQDGARRRGSSNGPAPGSLDGSDVPAARFGTSPPPNISREALKKAVGMAKDTVRRAGSWCRTAPARATQAARNNALARAIYRGSGVRMLARRWRAISPARIDALAAAGRRSLAMDGNAAAGDEDRDIARANRESVARALADFGDAFPERRDRLTAEEVEYHLESARTLRAMFEYFDIIQCYATFPLIGYLAGNKPYVGFEHGTLRTFTLGDDPLHRLTALGYRKADHVFITNGDCLDYARRIGVTKYSAMIHPVDVDQHRSDHGIARGEIKRRLGADVLLFCPLRHDWAIKGTDIHLRALPLLRAVLPGRIVLVLIRWGAEVEASETLLAELGCAEDVVWTPPLSRITLIRLMRDADVVLDQIALPHFGATAPQSLAAGTPVISSYEPESTAWIVDEPAPILPAFTPEDVAKAVTLALDPEWRARFGERARRWIDGQHHQNRIINEHLRIYRETLESHRDAGP